MFKRDTLKKKKKYTKVKLSKRQNVRWETVQKTKRPIGNCPKEKLSERENVREMGDVSN